MLDFSKLFVCESTEHSTYIEHYPAPLFRKSIMLDKSPDSAELLIAGLGFYRLFVNGSEITKGYIAPYISNPDDIVYYDYYDIKCHLAEGENVIGVMLGDGIQNLIGNVWDFDKTIWNSSPKLALSLKIVSNGKETILEADSFKCTSGAITFNNYRNGVHYDARLEKEGWCCAGYDDSGWEEPLRADIPKGYARLCEVEPIKERSEMPPCRFYKGEVQPYTEREDVTEYIAGRKTVEGNPPYTGGYIYDFGKNSSGVFRLRIKNTTRGQKISLQCAERLSADGRLDYRNINFYPDGYCQRDIYICKGADEEVFVPPFVYHGYRYLYVHGITQEQATKELLTYIEINTPVEERASFYCSDQTASKLFDMAVNSSISNLHYLPTDDPHREKHGWTGDVAASAEHMTFTLSVEDCFREWMYSVRKAQNEKGYLPGIVPTNGWGFAWGNGPAWDRVLFDLPYYAFIYRGKTDMINENAHAMLRYLELITRVRNKHGIVTWGLGDWCPPGRKAWQYVVDEGFTNGIMIMDMCKKAQIMFNTIGLTLHAGFAKRLGEEMRLAVRKMYLDKATMTIEGCSQTGQAMAIYYDLLDEAEKEVAVRVLVDIIRKNGGYLNVGFLGARCLFHVLSDYGYSDLAFDMITRTGFPSYGELVKAGLTTLPEWFASEEALLNGELSSTNHHFFGDISHWFLRQISGINVNPTCDNPNHIVIKPHFVTKLSYAGGEYKAPHGSVEVKWTRAGDDIILSVRRNGDLSVRVCLENGYIFERTQTAFLELDGGIEGERVVKHTL